MLARWAAAGARAEGCDPRVGRQAARASRLLLLLLKQLLPLSALLLLLEGGLLQLR